jgi:TP901 family phage tail tape measure protein
LPIPDLKIVITGIDKFSGSLGRPIKALESFGKKASQVGKSITRNLTLPIVGIGTAASIASVKINKGMANVATLIPGNIARVAELKKGMMDLGEEVGKRSKVMTEGLFQVISAFGDGADTMKKFRINARAAVGGVSSVKEAIDLTSSVTLAYGDVTLETTQKVADLAFSANKLGKTTFREMAGSIGKVTQFASNLNVTMEEMFASMATATLVTKDSSIATTQIASALGALLKPTVDMEIAFEKLRVTGGAQLIQQKGLQGAFQAIDGVAKKYNVRLSKLIGSKEALNFVMGITGSLSEKYSSNLLKMSTAAGASEEAFEEQADGINKAGFKWDQFMVKIENTGARIGDKLVPILTDLGQKYIMPLIGFIGRLSDTQIKWVIGIGAALAAIGPLIVLLSAVPFAIISVLTSISFLVIGIKALSAAAIFLATNPIGWLIAGAIALTVGFYLLIKNWDKVVAGFKIGWKFIVQYAKIGIGYLIKGLKFVNNILNPLNDNFETLIKTFKALAQIALPKWLEAKIGLSDDINTDSSPIPGGKILDKIGAAQTNKSEFSGTLRIVGAPVRSEIEVQQGSVNIEMDSGLQPAGVAF